MGEVDTSPSVGLVQHMIECGRSPDTMNQRVWPNWQVADALEAHAERAIETLTAKVAQLEAERDGMREALRRIAKPLSRGRYAGEQFKWAQDVATRALNNKEQKND